MNKKVREFINEYSQAIDDNAWDEVYYKASTQLDSFTGALTDALLEAGIDPLNYLDYVPEAYCFGSKTTDIVLPEGIKTISIDAFADSKLEKIDFPSSLKTIDYDAFQSCNLTEIDLHRVQELGSAVFLGCKKLQKAIIPASVDTIPDGTFQGCTSLSSVEIEDGITRILSRAFANCVSLDEIFIPDSVTFISMNAFPDHTDIKCHENSYAHEYCIAKDRNFILV